MNSGKRRSGRTRTPLRADCIAMGDGAHGSATPYLLKPSTLNRAASKPNLLQAFRIESACEEDNKADQQNHANGTSAKNGTAQVKSATAQ